MSEISASWVLREYGVRADIRPPALSRGRTGRDGKPLMKRLERPAQAMVYCANYKVLALVGHGSTVFLMRYDDKTVKTIEKE